MPASSSGYRHGGEILQPVTLAALGALLRATSPVNLSHIFDLFAEDNRLISNDVGNVKTHFLRSGRRRRLS